MIVSLLFYYDKSVKVLFFNSGKAPPSAHFSVSTYKPSAKIPESLFSVQFS